MNLEYANFENYNATSRNEGTKVRYWAVPGTPGFEYRNGGLEKDYFKGGISSDPLNHQKMVDTRAQKIQNVQRSIPDLEIFGNENADLLVVGWGSTRGHLMGTVSNMNSKGKNVAMAHFNYINPLPKNTAEVLKKFKKIVVCELNSGQFAAYLRAEIPGLNILQYNKVQGQPFTVTELEEQFEKILK